jgi:protoheme IX farnesyltransferase
VNSPGPHPRLSAQGRANTLSLSPAASIGAIFELTKPRITLMVLITTLGGLWLGHASMTSLTAIYALIGTAVLVGGANALNMYVERDTDGLMARTRRRPLPSGRLSPSTALAFGVFTSVAGVALLTFGTNPLTGLIGALSLVIYVGAYTPLKRKSSIALLVGAIPGAAPPLLGHTAATGALTTAGLALFLILFLWQVPHFIAISLFRFDDYQAAGLKTVPGESGIARAKERIVLTSLLTVAASLQAVRTGIAGNFYLGVALAVGGGLVTISIFGLQREAGARWARWYFLYTLVYLPVLFGALVLGRT